MVNCKVDLSQADTESDLAHYYYQLALLLTIGYIIKMHKALAVLFRRMGITEQS